MGFRRKRGQITIFVIIALILVAGIIFYFVARNSFESAEIPASLEPAYNGFLDCVKEQADLGIGILEQQGGYIELPEFVSGSSYVPFSSQLDFAGVPIPYWYYVDYAGRQEQQVPSKSDMEKDLENFIDLQIEECNFDEFYEEEYEIVFDESETDVEISGEEILIDVNMDLSLSKSGENVVVKNHEISVDSSLGNLYNEAKRLYEYEQESLFLEKYAVDNLRLYAPVDGVEIGCAPEIWSADKVFQDLEQAIEFNTLALKTSGASEDYFAIDFESNYDINFLNSRNWAHAFEVSPNKGNLLVAEPVGNSPGLGILGFCYVPYHYVYNVYYPVLAQVSSGKEIFQFPMAVVIEGNKEREALNAVSKGYESEVCKYYDTEISVRTYDNDLNPIAADISYDCLGEKCDIGNTQNNTLFFPQCVNGKLIASAKGYKDSEIQFSSVDSGEIEMIMDKLYELEIDLKMNSKDYNKQAMISFVSLDHTQTILYPEQKTIELAEGEYEVQVQIYRDSSLNLGATTQQQCVEVPSSGLDGLLGFTEEKCYDIEVPEQIATNVLAGGGKKEIYVLESKLASSDKVVIGCDSLPAPTSLEQLQKNYELFEDKEVNVYFQ